MSIAHRIRLNRGRMLALIETTRALRDSYNADYDLYDAEINDELVESRFVRSSSKSIETPRRLITITGHIGLARSTFQSKVELEGTPGFADKNTIWTVVSTKLV